MCDVSFDDWAACPAGEIQRVAVRGKRRRRIRWMMTVSAVVGVLGLALFLSTQPNELPPFRHPIDVEYYYGGIACSEVISNL